eukprot:9787-Rhodomonas_salina.2
MPLTDPKRVNSRHAYRDAPEYETAAYGGSCHGIIPPFFLPTHHHSQQIAAARPSAIWRAYLAAMLTWVQLLPGGPRPRPAALQRERHRAFT